MKPTMSMFASIADYNAALDADKSAVIAHYAAEEAKAAEEARMRRHAAAWARLSAASLDDVRGLAMCAPSMTVFLSSFTE